MPRSMRTTSAWTPSASSDSRPAAKSVRMNRVRQLTSPASSAKRSSATGSRSRPMSRPSGPRRSAISRACPPPPTVQSIATSPGRGSRSSSASSARTGSWVMNTSARHPPARLKTCSTSRLTTLSRLAKLRGDVGDVIGERGVVLRPPLAVPDLQAFLRPGHDDLLAEGGVLDEEGRQPHAAGGVELGVERVGRVEGAQLAALRRMAVVAVQGLGGEALVLGGRPQLDAALDALRQHDA